MTLSHGTGSSQSLAGGSTAQLSSPLGDLGSPASLLLPLPGQPQISWSFLIQQIFQPLASLLLTLGPSLFSSQHVPIFTLPTAGDFLVHSWLRQEQPLRGFAETPGSGLLVMVGCKEPLPGTGT